MLSGKGGEREEGERAQWSVPSEPPLPSSASFLQQGPPSRTYLGGTRVEGSLSFEVFMLQLNYVSANILNWEKQSELRPGSISNPHVFPGRVIRGPATPGSSEGKGGPAEIGPLLIDTKANPPGCAVYPEDMTSRFSLAWSQPPWLPGLGFPVDLGHPLPGPAVTPLRPQHQASGMGARTPAPAPVCPFLLLHSCRLLPPLSTLSVEAEAGLQPQLRIVTG